MESHGTHSLSLAMSCDHIHGELSTRELIRDSVSRVSAGGLSCQHPLRSMYLSSGLQKEGRCSTRTISFVWFRHSEPLFLVLGVVGNLLISKFSDAGRASLAHRPFQAQQSQAGYGNSFV